MFPCGVNVLLIVRSVYCLSDVSDVGELMVLGPSLPPPKQFAHANGGMAVEDKPVVRVRVLDGN